MRLKLLGKATLLPVLAQTFTCNKRTNDRSIPIYRKTSNCRKLQFRLSASTEQDLSKDSEESNILNQETITNTKNNTLSSETLSKQEELLLSLGLIDEVEDETEKEKRRLRRLEAKERVRKEKSQSIIVAVMSALLAICNYIYQYLHPISSIELLLTMQQSSAPITEIGKNSKPTVIDFWAPWCENCKASAPTLYQMENEFKDKVNFIMVNGDDDAAWDLIVKFGVDAIPHLALIDEKGYVETALIGPVSGNVLREDLNVMLDNVKRSQMEENKIDLPYKMFNAFYNRPQERTVQF